MIQFAFEELRHRFYTELDVDTQVRFMALARFCAEQGFYLHIKEFVVNEYSGKLDVVVRVHV